MSNIVVKSEKMNPNQQSQDVFPFGIYGGYAPTYGITHFNYAALAALGIKFIYVNWIELTRLEEAMALAQANGIQIILNGVRFFNKSESDRQAVIDVLQTYDDVFIGMLCCDEPHLIKGNQDRYLSQADHILRTINDYFPNKINIIDCFPNYATHDQIFNDGKSGDLTQEEYDLYIQLVASIPTPIICGDHYAAGNTHKSYWLDYLRTIRRASLKFNKPVWQFALCSKHLSYPIVTKQDLQFSIYINMMFGAQAIIWFLYGDYNYGNLHYSHGLFDTSGNTTSLYTDMQDLLTGEAKNYGSLFKNSTITDVELYTPESEEMPSHVKEIVEGEAVITNFTKGNTPYIAIFGFTDATVKLYSNYRRKVNSDLTITILPLRLNNSFEVSSGELIILEAVPHS